VRKLALVLASLAACFPGWVQALGLGDITLHSYLNQPLNAEIPVISDNATDLQSLKVGLASPQDFQRLGVDYGDSLRQLRFALVRKGGHAFVKVTSEGDFREPFADFVLEVYWENGRLLRQYTLLVDPPVMVPGKPAMTQGPAVSAAAPAPAPAPVARTGQAAMATASAPGTYPIQRNDTLWRIANRVRPDESVTVDQAMIALLKANSDAFIGNNINRLKAGYVLQVPDRAAMTSISAAEARAEVRQQSRAWRARNQPAAAAPAPAGSMASKGRLELLAPENKAAGAATADSGAAGAAGQTKQLAMAKEATEAQRQENADLRSRVDQLQEQIDNMKRLANLKDEQLAALQQQLAAAKGEQPAAEQPAAEQPAGEQPAGAAAPTEPAAPAPEAAAKPALVPATPAPADQPANPYAVKDFKPVDTAALPKETVKQPFKPMVPGTAAQPQPEAVSFVDKIKAMAADGWSMARANPMISGGVAGVLVLLLFVMALARRRTAASAGFQESILQAPKPAAPEAPVAEAAADAAATAAATEEEKNVEEAATSYLSDFAVSGMDTLQSDTSEADPLTEADVFLAYGRFQPAEAMIEEAIEAEPQRVDLKAKLLEIYHAARNAEAFERQAGVYQADLQSEPDTWEKVADMGRELCPDSPMFRGDVAPAESMEDEFNFDLDAGSTEGPSDEVLDFDLGEIAPSVDEDKPEENLAGDLADELSDIAETMTPEPAMGEESGGLEFETVAEPAGAEPEAESEVVDGGLLSDVDEVGTKLDLARAYIDMGDPEGARSILDEVMEEGNEAQKGEAAELLSQIS